MVAMMTYKFLEDEQFDQRRYHASAAFDTPLADRFDHLARMAQQIFDVPIVLVNLFDGHRQWFRSCIGSGAKEIPQELSFCGYTALSRDLFLVPDTEMDERFAQDPLVLGSPHIRYYAGCPLKSSDGSIIGTLSLIDRQPRELDNNQQEIFRGLGVMAEHELAIAELAMMDELTGISNRRGFMHLAQHSLVLCLRQKIPASLVFIDLDRFKSINDRFGHAEGDRVLREFAGIMQRNFRVTDLCARLSGDEFAILLINSGKELASEVIEKLSLSVTEMNASVDRDYEVVFSYGVVEFDVSRHSDIHSLLEDADKIMYQHKRSRRSLNPVESTSSQ